MKLRVGLICGGVSPEHEISLKSAFYISQFMDKCQFQLIVLWINKKGRWFVIHNYNSESLLLDIENQYDCSPLLIRQTVHSMSFCVDNFNTLLKLDVVFPIIHGVLGEDGSLQGLLNIMNLPYVGSDVLSSAICMDKDIMKRLLRDAGLPIVPFKTFFIHERKKIKFIHCVSFFGLPFVIKPVNQGSSIGISKIDSYKTFFSALETAFFYSSKIIIEPCILGRELECAVLGNFNPQASVCGEIVSANNFYTYSDKYTRNDTKVIIPALLDEEISYQIQCLSINAFKILNCLDMARVDIFLNSKNEIFINEVNTLPGFTSNSMYPKLWEFSGLKTKLLLTKLIELAIDRYNNKHGINSIN